jgi:hypothetical protein
MGLFLVVDNYWLTNNICGVELLVSGEMWIFVVDCGEILEIISY